MTTEAAAKQYLEDYQLKVGKNKVVIFNPEQKPIEELPAIYGFNNGGEVDMLMALLIAEDGTYLGCHGCSHEGYMPGDLGVIHGTRPDRHEKDFLPHYPDGYRMEFVGYDDVPCHEKFQIALAKHKEKYKKEIKGDADTPTEKD